MNPYEPYQFAMHENALSFLLSKGYMDYNNDDNDERVSATRIVRNVILGIMFVLQAPGVAT